MQQSEASGDVCDAREPRGAIGAVSGGLDDGRTRRATGVCSWDGKVQVFGVGEVELVLYSRSSLASKRWGGWKNGGKNGGGL